MMLNICSTQRHDLLLVYTYMTEFFVALGMTFARLRLQLRIYLASQQFTR